MSVSAEAVRQRLNRNQIVAGELLAGVVETKGRND